MKITKSEILSELDVNIKALKDGNSEPDGFVHDPGVFHSIVCLETAINLIAQMPNDDFYSFRQSTEQS